MKASIVSTAASTFAEILPPKPKLLEPLSKRIGWCITLYLCKFLANIYYLSHPYIRQPPTWSHPTLVKRYPIRPTLECRFFFPPTHTSTSLLPIYLNIHGGGFAFGQARQDDEFCASWAKRTGMLVVSLDYRKAPLHPFPTATHDIAALANAVLDDDAIPIDKSRVCIGGFSAGGNLALTAAQLPGLKGVVKAAVVYYPVVDFSINPDEKLASRPYVGGPPDRLGAASWWLDWGYVPVGQDRRDALISPSYAKKEHLPPWILAVGAQWDMFRLETQTMMHALAGLGEKQDQEEDFEKGTYKWMLMRGLSHGFTHYLGRDEVKRRKLEERCEDMYCSVHEWLRKSVLQDDEGVE